VLAWQRISCSILLCAWGAARLQPQTEAASPTVDAILARMAQARTENRTRLRPYSVIRNYTLFGKEKLVTQAEVIADVSFVPPAAKQFVIQKASGTLLGEKIVRLMLENEIIIVKNYGANDMSAVNYDFRFVREEELAGQHCFVLEITPRRQENFLLRGRIWVDAATYMIRRTEGAPGKPPSWWIRDARITLVYGDVGGMWLQISSESSADIRLLGRHTIVSRDVEYKMSQLAAKERAY
jgi:hypothetical protein